MCKIPTYIHTSRKKYQLGKEILYSIFLNNSYFAALMPSQVDANLIKIRSLLMPSSANMEMNFLALLTLAALSKLSRASTSMLTRPGTILRISHPNRTKSLSIAAVNFSSELLQ